MAIQDEIRSKNRPKKAEPTSAFGKSKRKKTPLFPQRGDSGMVIARKLLYLGAVVVLLVSLIILFLYYKQEVDATKLDSELKSLSNSIAENSSPTVVTTPPPSDAPLPILPLAEELLKQNPETVGWIKVPNTLLDYPVVLKKDAADGNSFYLTHNFKGESSRVGAIFADSRTTIEDRKQSKNIVQIGRAHV